MAIEFDFYTTHGALAEKSSYHVRAVHRDMVDTETLIENIQRGTTLTIPDLKGAVSALSQEITNQLKEGRKVYLEGLGYFSISIDGEVVTDKNEQLRLKNPRVRTIKFQPEEQMMRQMGELSFTCQGHKGGHSQPQDEESVNKAISDLLSQKPFFTARDFFSAAHVTPATGYRLLNELLQAQVLVNIGTPSHKLFSKKNTL